MHNILPVFPLSLVAFPGELVNLHIFEPRYLQLIADCEAEGRTFGIPLILEKKLYSVGTEMELVEVVKRYPNDRLDIRVRGIGRYEGDINLFQEETKLYSSCRMKRFTGNPTPDLILQEQLFGLLQELHSTAEVSGKLPETASTLETFKVAHYAGLDPVQKNQLLAIPDEVQRSEYLITHLEMMLPAFKMMQELKERAKMNGHFRVVESPE